MDRVGFRAYLESRQASEELIECSIALAARFESHIRAVFDAGPERASADAARAFARGLMRTGENTFDSLLALARFGRFLNNQPVLVAFLEMVDGHEALGNLHHKIEEEAGARGRDEIFDGVDIPPLGVSNLERARRMRTVVERLEARWGKVRAGHLIGQGLRDLPDASYAGECDEFRSAGGIDEYLRRKGDRFIAELEGIRDAGGLYFSQPITNEVIAYVESHPEIRQGVRVSNVIYEAKIPYMAEEFLKEADAKKKAYLYCHCPWARESLKGSEATVPAGFCNCSGAYHRRPYEVIFGRTLQSEVLETVLAGDPWCRFAIHLPEDIAQDRDAARSSG
jgi:hypothetical protein